jgi:homoserine kinase type II
MAVLTDLNADQMENLLRQYGLNPCHEYHGILQGIENTNYRVRAGNPAQNYIVTIFENRSENVDLNFIASYTAFLNKNGIACPFFHKNKDGHIVTILSEAGNKKASIVSFLNGFQKELSDIQPQDCYHIGKIMASMHSLSIKNSAINTPVNSLSLDDLLIIKDKIFSFLSRDHQEILTQEFKYLYQFKTQESTLPQGVIHADLFPDNVFFNEENVCGVIDFYYACHDVFLYDCALTINSWCFDLAHCIRTDYVNSYWLGYESVRPLDPKESVFFPMIARRAALRILMTRLYDFHHVDANNPMIKRKDPVEYWQKLQYWQSITE